ncbi:hypothetical protein BDY19DRAFT_999014 [Irpex rosettiformis]|uniref:Uncharacterized protein n=1 Tax=Irpex rosettiformis TaxID=378272 RepID=A0ACB8TLR3_9APHY|nr:hypothetical protein BDY19DRAFT_999014 [Irpex rosettiformis]
MLYSFLPLSSLVFVFGRSQPTAHTYVSIPHPVHLALPADACLSLLEPPTTEDHRMCTLILFSVQWDIASPVTVPSSFYIPSTFTYNFEDGYHDSYSRVISEVS